MILLIQLLAFHAYLAIKGMTTYEFITRNRVKPVSGHNSSKLILATNPASNEDQVIEQKINSEQLEPPHEGFEGDHPISTNFKSTPMANMATAGIRSDSELALIKISSNRQESQPMVEARSDKDYPGKTKHRKSNADSKTPR